MYPSSMEVRGGRVGGQVDGRTDGQNGGYEQFEPREQKKKDIEI